MKKFREVSAPGADPYSLKKIVVLLAYRCQKLEAKFDRKLEAKEKTTSWEAVYQTIFSKVR